MTPEQIAALREPFAPEQIGQKPQPYQKDSPKGFCRECGQKHGLPAMHLDFVGHAIVTDRLLKIDPEWTWEPMGFDERGVPALDGAGNLWIWLTICGVRKPGVGDGPDAKQKISDALRNAAMRFGVALDLWSKQEMASNQARPDDDHPEARSPAEYTAPLAQAKARAWNAMLSLHPDWPQDKRQQATEIELTALGSSIADATTETWSALAEELEARAA